MGGFPLPWGGAVGMRRLTPPRGGRGPGLPPPSSLTAPPAGLWVLSPRTQQTSALRIAAARGYEECARHLLLCGAEVDAVVGGRGALHDSVAAPRPSCARLLLSFGADPNLLSSDGSAPLHLCTAPDSLQYAPPPAPSPAFHEAAPTSGFLICMPGSASHANSHWLPAASHAPDSAPPQ